MTTLLSTDDQAEGRQHASVEQHEDVSRTSVDSRFCCNICLDAVVEPVVTRCGHLFCWPCLFRWLEPGMYQEERGALGLAIQTVAVNSSRRVCPVCKSACSVPTLVPLYVRSHECPPTTRSTRSGLENEQSPFNERMGTDAGDNDINEGCNLEPSPSANTTSPSDNNHDMDPTASTGLRHRMRSRSGISSDATVDDGEVPSRPVAMSPRSSHPASSPSTPPQQQHQHHQYRSGSNPLWITPLSPTGHRASLSHGLLSSLQQAGFGPATHGVPPIHRHDGRGNAATVPGSMNGATELEINPGEYLSRVLIMLASFVILCLLWL